jgi:large subunit ribosomal protein L29e
MAKSKNHSNHNQGHKNHRNGIKRPRIGDLAKLKGVIVIYYRLTTNI